MNTMQITTREVSYRKASEDRLFHTIIGDKAIIAVADGVGGRENGAEAAQFAIDAIRRQTNALPIGKAHYWSDTIHALDASLLAENEAGQTTLVALCITPNTITGVRVGDSEAWWIEQNAHHDLTEGENKKPYLGSGAAHPFTFHHPLSTSGTLLIATDGLFKYAAKADIIALIAPQNDLEETADALVQLARGKSGTLYDDLALVLVRPPILGASVGNTGILNMWKQFIGRG
jgi:serine/threonine protein phosphatase PrpC